MVSRPVGGFGSQRLRLRRGLELIALVGTGVVLGRGLGPLAHAAEDLIAHVGSAGSGGDSAQWQATAERLERDKRATWVIIENLRRKEKLLQREQAVLMSTVAQLRRRLAAGDATESSPEPARSELQQEVTPLEAPTPPDEVASASEAPPVQDLGEILARLDFADLPLVEVVADQRRIRLEVGEQFGFEDGVARLTASSEEVIAEVFHRLFRHLERYDPALFEIRIEGHASPTFRQQFVAPEDQTRRSYGFNIALSQDRAQHIVERLRQNAGLSPAWLARLEPIGLGYTDPVAFDPQRSDPADRCGERYDCRRSRRVEILIRCESESALALTPSQGLPQVSEF